MDGDDKEILLFEGFDLEGEAFAKFHRALRKKDQQALDNMIRAALERYSMQEKLLEHLTPIERLLLLVLMEQHKHLEHLESRIEELQEKIKILSGYVPPEQTI